MKKIIALYAKHDSGKSLTLLKVIERIRKIAEKEIFYKKLGDEELSDVAIIIVINKVIVGVTSRGDFAEELKAMLEKFLENGCIIIVCPTRTKQTTVKVVEKFSSDNEYELKWIEKSRTDDDEISQDKLNSSDAEKIFNEITSGMSSGQVATA